MSGSEMMIYPSSPRTVNLLFVIHSIEVSSALALDERGLRKKRGRGLYVLASWCKSSVLKIFGPIKSARFDM